MPMFENSDKIQQEISGTDRGNVIYLIYQQGVV